LATYSLLQILKIPTGDTTISKFARLMGHPVVSVFRAEINIHLNSDTDVYWFEKY